MASTTPPQRVDLSATATGPKDPAIAALMADLQGDILKPNARDFAAYVVIKLPASPGAAGGLLAQLAGRYVTSAAKQAADAAEFRENRTDGGLFGTLALSRGGYLKLGIPLEEMPRDRDARFQAGMDDVSTQQLLNDPPVSDWAGWAQPGSFDALLGLFDNTQANIDAAVAAVEAAVVAAGGSISIQKGHRLKRGDESMEPFGFTDGISQPVFFSADVPPIPPGGFDPSAPLDLVLIHDPKGAGPQSCGSFLVYRKLKQDVGGFNGDVAALASELGINTDLAGAYAVGRFKDGTPVVVSDHSTGQKDPDNTFQFDIDPDGLRCPFQAHIRKANPRGDTTRSNGSPLVVERSHRIVRRAMVFDDQDGRIAQTGLQFLCYQSDIGNQFEFIQSSWSNQQQFLRLGTGIDAVIGQSVPRPAPDPTGGQPWPNVWGDARAGTALFDFGRWVTLLGGAYLFVPSISFLKGLGQGPNPDPSSGTP